ncbi:MAG: hypothetical protein IPP03_14645 [Dechloromonas sp.]|jgi:hypothetical protein|nr:hypothetical protein [Candidatus Dechloromonas phosphoritropha]MBP8787314.1 hypothetical protein [Azonexus sp.]MBP9227623.1 hypothetical protein [Azonexus sp.]
MPIDAQAGPERKRGSSPCDAVGRVRDWLRDHHIGILNVAGPRECKRPGIYRATLAFLDWLA